MKHLSPDQIQIVEVEVSKPAENETQRQLRGILEYWGPNGERHCCMAVDGEKRCAVRAYEHLYGEYGAGCSDAIYLMNRAAREMGFGSELVALTPVAQCSDSGFPNARKMVLRAIELAAHPSDMGKL